MADDFEVGGATPEDSENRTFVAVAAGLGGLIVLSLICLGVYALVLQPRQRQAAESRPTEIMLTNTAVALGLTETAEAGLATPTPEPSNTPRPTSTPRPSNTPTQVVVLPTDTPGPSSTPLSLPTVDQTATAAARLTQTAEAIAGAETATPRPTATALPTTGFGEEAGLPGLAGLAAVLLAVIFLSRRLRTANTSG